MFASAIAVLLLFGWFVLKFFGHAIGFRSVVLGLLLLAAGVALLVALT